MLIILQLIILLPVIIPLYIYDRLKNKRCHLFGIEGYFGLMGQGKTICMTRRLLRLRKKYGNKIYICTNYGFVHEDFSFTDWHMLFADWDKPLVVAWDEVQNEFNSRAFKSFPVELLTQLTQVRKDNGILLLYSAQRWARVDKVFRELSVKCWQCRTFLGRFTWARCFDTDTYDSFCSEKKVAIKHSYNSHRYITFIQTKKLRESYNSYKMLKTAKNNVELDKYMDREELARIRSGVVDAPE